MTPRSPLWKLSLFQTFRKIANKTSVSGLLSNTCNFTKTLPIKDVSRWICIDFQKTQLHWQERTVGWNDWTAGSELHQTQTYCLHNVNSWAISKLTHANSTYDLNHVCKALTPFYVLSQIFSMIHILSPRTTIYIAYHKCKTSK